MEVDSTSIYLWLILIVAVGLYTFVSLAEAAIGSLSRARIKRLADQDEQAARHISAFAENPARYLTSAAIIKPMVLIAAVIAGIELVFGPGPAIKAFVVWIVGIILAVVLGRIVPLAFGAGRPEETALLLALPYKIITVLISPFVHGVALTTRALTGLIGVSLVSEGPVVTPAELRVMVAASEEEGLIQQQERTMIDNILELEQRSVREVMVPRPDIVALSSTTTVRGAIDTFVREGYSRLPVFRDTIDDIVGILYGKDLFALVIDERLSDPIGDFVRPAYFVPESKRANDLLRELQLKRVHIAIVVDEYGGTAGMVTIEDLLEEIVGEIQDEFDVEEQKIVKTSDGEALVDGGVSIDDANAELGLDLEAEQVDTVGGLVHEKLGRIPVVGDKVLLDHALLTVVSSSGRRVTRVRVKHLPDTSSNGTNGTSVAQIHQDHQ